MIRFMNLNTAFLALTLLVAYGTYHVKYESQRAARELRSIETEIESEKNRERVLQADWSLLNEPGRLQKLAQRHLTLAPVEAKQIVTVAELKARVPIYVASSQTPARPMNLTSAVVTPASLEAGSRTIVIKR